MPDPRNKVLLQSPGNGNLEGYPGLFDSKYFEILSENYSESYVDGQPSIGMRVRTRWPGSYQFIANMIGTPYTDLTSVTGMGRFPPARFPDTDYHPEIFSQGDANSPFLGWWCTSAKLVGTHSELTCQDQVTGALVPPLKPDHALIENVDYNPTTGDLIDAGYDALSNKPEQRGVGFAEYDLVYEPLPYEILTDAEQATLPEPLNSNELCRHVIRRYRFQGSAFTLAPGSLYWRDDLLAEGKNTVKGRVDSSAVKIFGSADLTYTWLGVPGIPWDAINTCLGKVNRPNTNNGDDIPSASYPSGTGVELPGAPGGQWDYRPYWQVIDVPGGAIKGFLPRTLMFNGVTDIVPRIMASGMMAYDISYSFTYRETGHNKIYRARTDTFERVIKVSTKDGPAANYADWVDTADFNLLFQLA